MSDHEFEKQVQSRMDQLKLRPSESVWAAVEKNVRKDKRRRRMIIWLPIALLMLGFGGWLMLDKSNQPNSHALSHTTTNTPSSQNTLPSDNSTPSANTSSNNTTPQPNREATAATTPSDNTKRQPNDPSVHTTEATTPPTTGHTASSTTGSTSRATRQPDENAVTSNKKNTGTTINTKDISTADRSTKGRTQSLANKPVPVVRDRSTTGQKKPAGNSIAGNSSGNRPRKGLKGAAKNTAQQPVADNNDHNNTGIDQGKGIDPTNDLARVDDNTTTTGDPVATVTGEANDPKDSARAIPPAFTTLTPKIKDTAATTPSVSALATLPKKKNKASKWQYGVVVSAGYSGVTKNGLFGFLDGKTKVADVTQQVNSAPQSNTFAPQFPRPVYKTPSITMGPAYTAGGFVQRNFNDRIKLSAGLQYSYLSAQTVVGTKVNSSRMVNYTSNTASMVAYYYDADNSVDYIHKYHFIELPVTFHWQLNKGKYLPLQWDFGVAANYLVSTTALHYDGQNGVYYKDNSFFNRMQWSATTGFNAGLFPQSKHPVLIGPMLRYNMTGLLKKEHYTGQHLWSVGLRASVLLKK